MNNQNKNLIAEMARANIKPHDIAQLINKDDRSAKNKINGVTDFTYPEAVKIRDIFFPGMRMEYLYASDNS